MFRAVEALRKSFRGAVLEPGSQKNPLEVQAIIYDVVLGRSKTWWYTR